MASMVSKDKEMTIAEKKAILDKVTDKINENANKVVCGRIGRMPEIQDKLRIKWIPTPSYRINKATGGGIPVGKFSIVSGNEDSGKTSLMLQTIGMNMQKDKNFFAAWLESENSLSLDYIVNTFHIDPERFFFIKHEKEGGAETALDILCAVADSGIFKMIVINSLKCLVPKTELDNSLEKDTIALQARLNSKMVKKFTAMIQEHDTAFVAITHKTTKIGTMSRDPLELSGGRAIRYASMLTIDLNKLAILDTDPIKKEDGLKIKLTVKKNHCVCDRFPYVSTEYYVRFGVGVAWEIELLEAAVDSGIIKSAGAWLTEVDKETGEPAKDVNGVAYKWNGKNAFKNYLYENPDYHKRLEGLVDKAHQIASLSSEEVLKLEAEMKEETNSYDDLVEDPIALSQKSKKPGKR